MFCFNWKLSNSLVFFPRVHEISTQNFRMLQFTRYIFKRSLCTWDRNTFYFAFWFLRPTSNSDPYLRYFSEFRMKSKEYSTFRIKFKYDSEYCQMPKTTLYFWNRFMIEPRNFLHLRCSIVIFTENKVKLPPTKKSNVIWQWNSVVYSLHIDF